MGLGQQKLMAECVNMIRGPVNCRITGLVRLRDAGPISERKTEELKQAVELRAELMRQIDWQDSAFDA